MLAAAPSRTSLKAGDELDHYRLDKCVAESATCAVFKALDLETGCPVAIKVPYIEAASDVLFYECFRREAAIGQELDHPGVPKVIREKRPAGVYLAMEWIEGQSLRQILNRESKLPAYQVVRIALGICEVLEYVHDHGVVHRDLKPENIVICQDWTVKLLDFGIATKTGARRLTFGKLSEIMGTADYISPEQVEGRRGDARSDLFQVGVILYEMLIGEMPFRGTNPLAIMNDRLVNDPIPPCEVDSELAPWLETILYRALARDPRCRYAGARELAYDLQHPDQVRLSSLSLRGHSQTLPKRLIVYSSLAMIPICIFLLLLYFAHQQ